MKFIFNEKTDATLIRFYQTYEKTLDTQDFVSPKTNAFVYRFIDKHFKKALRIVDKETRIQMKKFKALAKLNGITLDEFFELLKEEEQQKAIESAVDAEPEEEPEAGEKDEETGEDGAEEPEDTPDEEDEQEQTG